MKNGLVAVKFNKDWRTYAQGETAGFSEHLAKHIVDSGAGSLVERRKLQRGSEKVTADAPSGMVTK